MTALREMGLAVREKSKILFLAHLGIFCRAQQGEHFSHMATRFCGNPNWASR